MNETIVIFAIIVIIILCVSIIIVLCIRKNEKFLSTSIEESGAKCANDKCYSDSLKNRNCSGEDCRLYFPPLNTKENKDKALWCFSKTNKNFPEDGFLEQIPPGCKEYTSDTIKKNKIWCLTDDCWVNARKNNTCGGDNCVSTYNPKTRALYCTTIENKKSKLGKENISDCYPYQQQNFPEVPGVVWDCSNDPCYKESLENEKCDETKCVIVKDNKGNPTWCRSKDSSNYIIPGFQPSKYVISCMPYEQSLKPKPGN